MRKNIVFWAIILFIIMPIAYYFSIMALQLSIGTGKVLNYIIMIVSLCTIIVANIMILKRISKK